MTTTTRKDDLLTALTEGIAQLTTSQNWTDWLNVQSRFHRYSFRNTLLILRQCPSATRVAGFRAWQLMGRQVTKGEKAIWILAPVTRKPEADSPSDGTDQASAASQSTSGRRLVAFKPTCVFDISQTYGEDLPEICRRLAGDDGPAVIDALLRVAESIGYSVTLAELDGQNGVCTFSERSIRIEVKNSVTQQTKTLAHELAHALLHEGTTDRRLAELEAESVAFVVCSNLGITTDEYSFGYCASWAGGGDEAITAIKASAQRIQRTADRILRSVEEPDHLAA